MYAVIFEVEPAPGRRQEYLDIAAQLRPELEKVDGFISVERFQSLTQEGKILSLSFWRDEAAVGRSGSPAAQRERRGGGGGRGPHRAASGCPARRPGRYFQKLSPAGRRRDAGLRAQGPRR